MEKKHYRLRENINWYFKRVWQEFPQYFLYSFFGIVLKAMESLLTVFLPAVLVKQLISHNSLSQTIIIVTLIGLGLALTSTFRRFVESKVMLFALGVRTNLQLILFKKSLTMDYQLMESAKVRELKQIAESEGTDQNSSGGEAFGVNSYYLVEVTLSFLLFGGALSFVHPLLLVLIMGTTLISFMSLKRIRRFRHTHKDEWGKIDAKRYYLKSNAYGIENGKDIRLYEMNNWYDQHIEKANHERLTWIKKESMTVFLSQLSQDTAVFARNLVAYVLLVLGMMKGGLTLPQFTLFFTVLNNVTSYVNKIAEHSHLLLKANQGLNDVRHYVELTSNFVRIERDTDSTSLEKEGALSIRFEKVSFSTILSKNLVFV
ncbi:hypothetical protein [uncultured Vagococcus sp.]|uniref:hypothetical protein n=1 Tax=uncultured Vagococcus sp. TaxID=189676 RepID=UPI0028D34BB0|nr:hypothetical protein [uncultured Vagococcus sp.]